MNEATMSAEIIAKIQAFLRKRFQNYEFADDEDIFARELMILKVT